MSIFKKASAPLLTVFLLATTLPISCTPTSTGNLPAPGTPEASGTRNAVNAPPTDGTGAISGIVSRGRSVDGRLVPPETVANVIVSQNGTEVARTKTDNRGRFYVANIPSSNEGVRYLIEVPEVGYAQEELVFTGQVKDLSNIQVKAAVGDTQTITTINATLLDPDGQALANVTVRDKEFSFRETTTDDNGAFVLETVSDQIEVVLGGATPPITVAVEEVERNPLVTVDINNIRSIRGVIKDSTNSNVALENVTVKIAGRSTSAVSDENGNYELNGVPLGPLSLEIIPPAGYAKTIVQIPPATFTDADGQRRPEDFVQLINLQPIGNIQVSFTSESALPLGEYPCDVNYNCVFYELDGVAPPSEPYYNNRLAVLNELTATISVEGTDISQTVTYPATPLLDLKGTDRFGEAVTLTEAYFPENAVISVLLEDVPGGKQNITISMTGHQTQKSISVFVPPKDTISTEEINLHRVKPITSIGDVQGIIKGIDPDVPGTVRIAYIDVGESVRIAPNTPAPSETIGNDLFPKIRTSLLDASSNTVVDKNTGEYYLKNVPTGSRIMLAAAAVTDDGEVSDCYIPSTSVLLNVRSGEINLAPDLTLTKRPIAGCP